ncbi:hypothetical protein E2C01_068648 [Portunus trituberculatus]|uniref:Uncharacterized protein n=1 Tax=Portunus trituberculatus TaxID=210409 RepID=A0A5B7HMX5_PORTR|nr:hypothetical protein [Portunus trituberculatus]
MHSPLPPSVSPAGGLFDDGDEEQKSAFRYAVDHVNRENILGRTKLNTDIEMIPPYDSFLASKRGEGRARGNVKEGQGVGKVRKGARGNTKEGQSLREVGENARRNTKGEV